MACCRELFFISNNMSHITKVKYVKADAAKMVEYIADVANHPAFVSALKSVDNLSGDSKEVGASWDWTYMMAGVELSGKAETTGYMAGQSYSYKTTTGALSQWTYSVEPAEEGTKLTVDIEYEVPENVLGKIVDKMALEGINDHEGEQAVENLKAILEG